MKLVPFRFGSRLAVRFLGLTEIRGGKSSSIHGAIGSGVIQVPLPAGKPKASVKGGHVKPQIASLAALLTP